MILDNYISGLLKRKKENKLSKLNPILRVSRQELFSLDNIVVDSISVNTVDVRLNMNSVELDIDSIKGLGKQLFFFIFFFKSTIKIKSIVLLFLFVLILNNYKFSFRE